MQDGDRGSGIGHLGHPPGPAQEPQHFGAVTPKEIAELGGSYVFGVKSPIGLHAPAQIGTRPRTEAISFCRQPEKADHFDCGTG